ncbi:hypothetical protein LSAT2_015663 [Lamellibrachia satsuma]|nr:hypothetical protein LSAT2_015663 [Lamellibrachia satsuma]
MADQRILRTSVHGGPAYVADHRTLPTSVHCGPEYMTDQCTLWTSLHCVKTANELSAETDNVLKIRLSLDGTATRWIVLPNKGKKDFDRNQRAASASDCCVGIRFEKPQCTGLPTNTRL